MKNNRLLHAIGQIDDAYVTEAVRRKAGKTLWLRVCAVAACVALLVGGGAARYNRYSYPDLPMLTIPEDTEGAMGREAYLAYSFEEMNFHTPWTPNSRIRTLPVYDNSRGVELHHADDPTSFFEEEAAMKQAILEKAALLGMDTSAPEFQYSAFYGYYLSDDRYTVSCTSDRLIILTAMPEDYTLDPYASYDELYRSAQYLLKEYRDVIGVENPYIEIANGDYTIYGEQSWTTVAIYDQVKDPIGVLLNHAFHKVRLGDWGDGQMGISFDRYDLSQVIGEYPIISVKKAQALLEKGYYVSSTIDPFPGTDTIKKVELTYHTAPWFSTFVPYYKFYVEEPESAYLDDDLPGIKSFATYYVPAVDSRYIADLKLWDGSING
ncbi:MAG: hypothetical protein IJC33_07270 [Clostridia bacterium]|nr:hypothetical protein [Clostridia bacterium]